MSMTNLPGDVPHYSDEVWPTESVAVLNELPFSHQWGPIMRNKGTDGKIMSLFIFQTILVYFKK